MQSSLLKALQQYWCQDVVHFTVVSSPMLFADQPEGPLQPVNPDRNYEENDRANKKPKVCQKAQLPSILDQTRSTMSHD